MADRKLPSGLHWELRDDKRSFSIMFRQAGKLHMEFAITVEEARELGNGLLLGVSMLEALKDTKP